MFLDGRALTFCIVIQLNPRLKVLLRNFVLSDDIAFRFSNRDWNEWPLTADKYASWLNKLAPKSELINIFLDYETFGEHNWKETGIFDFLHHLPGSILKKTPLQVYDSDGSCRLSSACFGNQHPFADIMG